MKLFYKYSSKFIGAIFKQLAKILFVYRVDLFRGQEYMGSFFTSNEHFKWQVERFISQLDEEFNPNEVKSEQEKELNKHNIYNIKL